MTSVSWHGSTKIMTHAPPSEDADDSIKTVSYIGTDEDWLAVVNPWIMTTVSFLIMSGLC